MVWYRTEERSNLIVSLIILYTFGMIRVLTPLPVAEPLGDLKQVIHSTPSHSLVVVVSWHIFKLEPQPRR